VLFYSLYGTLDDLFQVDGLWMGRFTREPVSFVSMDQELYEDLQSLSDRNGKR